MQPKQRSENVKTEVVVRDQETVLNGNETNTLKRSQEGFEGRLGRA